MNESSRVGDEQGSSALQINRVSRKTVKELRKTPPGRHKPESHPCR